MEGLKRKPDLPCNAPPQLVGRENDRTDKHHIAVQPIFYLLSKRIQIGDRMTSSPITLLYANLGFCTFNKDANMYYLGHFRALK